MISADTARLAARIGDALVAYLAQGEPAPEAVLYAWAGCSAALESDRDLNSRELARVQDGIVAAERDATPDFTIDLSEVA